MIHRSLSAAALAAVLLASRAPAQDIEPNTTKAEATANGTLVLSAGGTIVGTTTGTSATPGDTSLGSIDTYRIRTTPLPIGIYRHRLTLTSTFSGHTGTLRGLNQSGTTATGGTAGTADTQIQTSITTSTPPRHNQWYGFGKQEELYYRVSGNGATTAPYTATLSTTPITPTAIVPLFEATTPVIVSTVGQTTFDTEIQLYDAALNLVGQNDNSAAGVQQSTITATLAPGTYYVAVSSFELCTSQVNPPGTEFWQGGWLMDFPDCVVLSDASLATADWDFQVIGSNGVWSQPNFRVPGTPFAMTWYSFTTANGAPPVPPANDDCANASNVVAGTYGGTVLSATQDGLASCDPGTVFSRDVWYAYTNPGIGQRMLTVSTCGTTALNDTVLSIHNACGGPDLACNDDNLLCAAQPTSSLIPNYPVNGGQTVKIRVSDKSLGGSGNFTLQVSVTVLAPSNDDCSSPSVLAGLGTFPVSNAAATTGLAGQSEPLCNQAGGTAIRQDVWFTWVAPVNGPVELSTCGLLAPNGGIQNTKIAVYDGTGCPTAAAIACNDDDTASCGGGASKLLFTAVCGNSYTFQFGMTQSTSATYEGGLAIVSPSSACSTPFTPECFGDTAALCPCGGPGGSGIPNPGAAGFGCANSAFGAGAQLVASGSAQDNAGDTLVLTCSNMPGPGLFFQANGLIGPILNFNDGTLCAASGIIRMGVVFPTAGVASYPGGLTPNPIHVAGAPVLAPTPTKHYQCWYRDITPGFCNTQGHNMSNGVALTWVP
jgi:hypothetical protein